MSNTKTALITGASSGIGKALADLHASKGGDLVITARSEHKLLALQKELVEKYRVKVEVIVKDLSKHNAPLEIFEAVEEKDITVDYLINNAGFGGQGYFHERDWAKDESMINLNILALTALTRLFLPGMVDRNSGRILNVASSAAMVPGGPLQSVYFATKAYVLSFSQGLAGELMDTNVRITALCPGATKTGFEKMADLGDTKLFSDAAFGPEVVAKDGYEAMLKGELVKKSALTFSQRVMFKMMPVVPTKMVLKQIKELQEVNT